MTANEMYKIDSAKGNQARNGIPHVIWIAVIIPIAYQQNIILADKKKISTHVYMLTVHMFMVLNQDINS